MKVARLVGVRDALGWPHAVIDARSPAEYAHVHVPRAESWPVLDDAQRSIVGTLYASDPLKAKVIGAAYVCGNVQSMLPRLCAGRDTDWAPLVYCARGGQRSRALATVLAAVGFDACVLDGGARAVRTWVTQELERVPPALRRLCVVSGRTGTGKTALLHALRERGEQVLDLEALACHRGSLLGSLPGQAQPSQVAFEQTVALRLRDLDHTRPVWVEAESSRIGSLSVPRPLVMAMQRAPRFHIEAPLAVRVQQLLAEYAWLREDVPELNRLLALLRRKCGAHVAEWQRMAEQGRMEELVGALLVQHYDRCYDKWDTDAAVVRVAASSANWAPVAAQLQRAAEGIH